MPNDNFPCSIFCNIKTNNNETFFLALVYRSPNNSLEENDNMVASLHSCLSKINPISDKILILGDFNLPSIDWEQETCTNEETHINFKFLNCIQEHYLTQFINKPTHFRGEQNPTLIDLILSNDRDFVFNIHHSAPFGLSHHSVISFSLNINQLKISLPPVTKFILEKGDYLSMNKFLKNIDWQSLFNNETDVNALWDKVEKEILTARDRFIPKRIIKKSSLNYKHKIPIPNTLLELFHKKRAAFKYFKKYPTTHNFKIYKTLRNEAKKASRLTKLDQELNIANKSKHNPKLLYQYISSRAKPRETISNLKKHDGTLTDNDLDKASVLNQFFASVFVHEGETPIPSFDTKCSNSLSLVNITTDDMLNRLKSLKINKSSGPDGIHPRILYENSEQLAYPLTLLFDATMNSGSIPIKWKTAEVKPIFKKGDRSAAGNYRPVSLTSVVCKLFESFIRDALCSHLVTNNLLSPYQFGFCKGRSCVTQLLSTINNWFEFLDDNVPVDAIYLDFQKAFDTVPHKRLLCKLKGYGIDGNLLNWIGDFLSGRTQHVSINNQSSNKVSVSSGVPQGSVLGPSLFIYFINDLPDFCDSLINIFADDTKVYTPISSPNDCCKLQNTINMLTDWSDKWLLKFNTSKCKVLHLGHNNPTHNYLMRNGNDITTLCKTNCEKDLGVHIDSKLNFNEHILNQVKKARCTAGVIHRNILNKTPNVMVPLYKSMVRPHLEYANTVWSPYTKKNINLIENIQRHFTKKITGLKHKSYEDRLKSLRLPSLTFRRLRGDLIEAYKIIHNIYDPITTSKLLKRVSNSSITRKHNSLNLTKIRTNKNAYKFFFTNRINNIWNNLPNYIVNAKNLNLFKNKVDAHFRAIMYEI